MPARYRFNNVSISAMTCAVPAYTQKIEPEKAANPEYVRNFQKQTGILQRQISLKEQTATDLAHGAALRVLEKSGVSPEDIDGLIFLSQMPDFNVGTGNAFIAHARLGLPANCLAFDMTLGCSSFPYGLATAGALLQQSEMHRILLLSCDPQWHFYDNLQQLLEDQSYLHGEGAVAVLLEKKATFPLAVDLYTDGTGYRYLFNPFANVRNAWRQDGKIVLPDGTIVVKNKKYNYMDGLEITVFSTTTVVESIKSFMVEQGTNSSDYDGLCLHQANMQIIKTIAKRLKFPMSKVTVSVDRYANASGVSLPLTIVDAYAGDKRERVRFLAAAFGIGLSWGVADISLTPSVIDPIFIYDGRSDDMLAQA